jgi:MYXO-CTERM domain-containing protein
VSGFACNPSSGKCEEVSTPAADDGGGCGCRLAAKSRMSAWSAWLAVLGLLGFRRVRRIRGRSCCRPGTDRCAHRVRSAC